MTRQIACTLFATALATLLLGGCSTLGYYGQAVVGQTRLLLDREPVARVLARPDTPPVLRRQLTTARAIVDYAQDTLGLEPGKRYSTWVATGRDAVVWNVVAAPELSLEPLTWCYPVVGCVPYRGYFRRERAVAMADRLRGDGNDVHVGGVPAYSTLGWFSDPLLDTFIDWPEGHLANLLIHELTHGRVWVQGDAVFNESLASFVGDAGARSWLADRGPALDRYVADELADARFSVSIDRLRSALAQLYRSDRDVAGKRLARAALLDRYRACYRRHRDRLGEGRYDTVVAQRLNNAFLAARRTYDRHLPAFAALFASAGGDWAVFFTAVDGLARLPAGERDAALARLAADSGQQQVTDGGDGDGTDEVGCEAFLGHVAGAEGAG